MVVKQPDRVTVEDRWGYLGVMSPKINVTLPDEVASGGQGRQDPGLGRLHQALADAVATSQGVDSSAPAARTHTAARPAWTRRARPPTAARPRSTWSAPWSSRGSGASVLEAADIAPEDFHDELPRRARPATAERGARRRPRAGGGAGRRLGHSYVGAEHLLLALTARATRELARRTLADMGLKHEQALRGVATALSAYRYARESITFAGISRAHPLGARGHPLAARAGGGPGSVLEG